MKRNKYSLAVVMSLFALSMTAQETYQDTKMIGNELNGTARYVGMGGAMEALGADISTISSNPAGVGLFRNSQVSLSGGFVVQGDATTSPKYGSLGATFKGDKVNASLDQLGVVYVTRTGDNSYLNFGFNYHKSRNFNQILTAGNSLTIPSYINGLPISASQNKLSALKFPYASKYSWSGVDANYEREMAPIKDANGKQIGMDYLNGTEYLFGQYQKGYIGEYDFNISGNIKDRVFLGFTLGLHDVNYNSNSYYTENLERNAHSSAWESLRISGVGVDIKLGAIFRPIENSPFRFGVYMSTPTFYDLSLKGDHDISLNNSQGQTASANYDYKIYTPWKFGLSVGHTVGKNLAFGATYEYADYSSINNRINENDYYDSSSSDVNMNKHTSAMLKGVSTLKLGAEYKPVTDFSIRLGYNFVSPMFKKDAYRDGSIQSPGTMVATSTDYTNWDSTNRLTFGLGYNYKKFFFDAAFQYSQTNGEFYPFMSYYPSKENYTSAGGTVNYTAYAADFNVVDATKVSFKRSQVLLTVGYRF